MFSFILAGKKSDVDEDDEDKNKENGSESSPPKRLARIKKERSIFDFSNVGTSKSLSTIPVVMRDRISVQCKGGRRKTVSIL